MESINGNRELMINYGDPDRTPMSIGYAEPDEAGDELLAGGSNKPFRSKRRVRRLRFNRIIRRTTGFRFHWPSKPQILRRYTEWQIGIAASFTFVCLVFLINLTLTIWVWVSLKPVDGIGIRDGNCATIKTLSLWIHLGINLLSSIVLAASNYCMQRLCALTRLDIDKAHAAQRWLHVGVPSIGNLSRIGGRRVILWLLIGLSSVPLHLLYNSAIFQTTGAVEPDVLFVNEDFFHNGTWSDAFTAYSGNIGWVQDLVSNGSYKNASSFQKLKNAECVQSYGSSTIFDVDTLLVVIDNESVGLNTSVYGLAMANSGLEFPQSTFQFLNKSNGNATTAAYGWPSWICDADPCHIENQRKNITHGDQWIIQGYRVSYCISKTLEVFPCTLNFSLTILIIITVANAIKAVCMLLALPGAHSGSEPLVTFGDAVQSFLDNPDQTTKGNCLLGRGERDSAIWDSTGAGEAFPWIPSRRHWGSAVRTRTWSTFLFLAFTYIGVAIFLGPAFETKEVRQWFSSDNTENLIGLGEAFISKGPTLLVAFTNLPQTLISFLYLFYNNIFTSMVMGVEWNSYGHKRKYLRVSSPNGKQRGTYWLQLPFTYSIPLLASMTLLHWLVSRSMFIVSVRYMYRSNIRETILQCGYSRMALLFTIGTGLLMMVALVINGLRRYGSSIPQAISCSAAISAACHAPQDDLDAALNPLKWGAVSHGSRCEPGHCCFTSKDVEPPIEGNMYA